MKKLIISLIGVISLAFSGLILADGSGTGIVGSPHDFADDFSPALGGGAAELPPGGWNLRGEICRVCHVPHDHSRGTQYYLNGLLWNHAVSTATYTMYDSTWSSTIDGTIPSGQPDGSAKLCLGCHDGTIAIDTFDKYAGTAGNEIQNIYGGGIADFRVPGFTTGGTMDLRGTHPLSIVYDFAADGGLFPTGNAMGTSGTIADVLDFGKVQCSSCHDVHDQEAVAGTHLLRVLNNGANPSGLCLTCHDK